MNQTLFWNEVSVKSKILCRFKFHLHPECWADVSVVDVSDKYLCLTSSGLERFSSPVTYKHWGWEYLHHISVSSQHHFSPAPGHGDNTLQSPVIWYLSESQLKTQAATMSEINLKDDFSIPSLLSALDDKNSGGEGCCPVSLIIIFEMSSLLYFYDYVKTGQKLGKLLFEFSPTLVNVFNGQHCPVEYESLASPCWELYEWVKTKLREKRIIGG